MQCSLTTRHPQNAGSSQPPRGCRAGRGWGRGVQPPPWQPARLCGAGPGLGKLRSCRSPRGGRGGAPLLSGLRPPKLTALGFGQSHPAMSLPPLLSYKEGLGLECFSLSAPGPCLLGEVCKRHRLALQPRKECQTLHCRNGRLGRSSMGALKETSRKDNPLQEPGHATSVSRPSG